MIPEAVPLRLSRERIALYGALLVVVASSPFIIFPQWFLDVAYRGDFANFWSAGATAGTSLLTNFHALSAWQHARHITPQSFVYPPGFAWFYAPFSHLNPVAAMVLQDATMVLLLGLCALIAAQTYGLARWFALVAVFAWGPAISSVELGQNTTLALVLTLGAIWALMRGSVVLVGVAIGLLLYKPSVGLPLLVLLLVRSQWRALAIAAAVGAAWYFLSVLATHGDWSWPNYYVRLLAGTNAGEFAGNAHKAYTIPTLLLALRVPASFAYGLALLVFVAGFAVLARAPMLQAASLTPLLGLATSPHSWPYEAALLVPTVLYAMTALEEPLRTRAVVAAYLIAALGLVVPYAAHSLALLPIGGTAWLFSSQMREKR